LRTKFSDARTRGPHALVYGEKGFRGVLAGLGAALAGKRICLIQADPCPIGRCFRGARTPGARDVTDLEALGTLGFIDRRAVTTASMLFRPCRVMAPSPGQALLLWAVRVVGTIGRRFR
jgi:hypothetical protein